MVQPAGWPGRMQGGRACVPPRATPVGGGAIGRRTPVLALAPQQTAQTSPDPLLQRLERGLGLRQRHVRDPATDTYGLEE
jgi:hypothetical protein